MKKYKLIKKYPGSPKLNTMVKKHENANYISECGYYSINPINIENQSEFWEEIIEKDYEILSYIVKNGKIYKSFELTHINDKLLTQSEAINFGYLIHSIKRLSDGEIFTIDDNTKYGCIDKFYIKNNHLLATTVLESNGRYLKDLEKLKQKLFTTEDGVDIFKNIDKYYTPIYIVDKALNIRYCKKDFSVKPSENVKYFSTKEKAEEYILLNKPCLSLNDLLKFFPDTYIPFKKGESSTEDINTEDLEKLVKQKLNNKN
jgi:hypothetical protein